MAFWHVHYCPAMCTFAFGDLFIVTFLHN
jgi:hypothetical protein